MPSIRIATRRSPLAMAQARFVAARLAELAPGLGVELVGIATRGDRDPSPAAITGKSSFVDALEEALREERADVAVHSMKDVAVNVPDGFALHTFGARADVRDALVVNDAGAGLALTDLPTGARVGTSSIRRRALLMALRRDLVVVPVRGNVDTRLRRLRDGGYDALLLACAGLDRLGLGRRIGQRVDAEVLVPAPGQGALAVQFLTGRTDVLDLVGLAIVRQVEDCVAAERQVTRRVGADCAMPFGAHCAPVGGAGMCRLRLTAVAADVDGTRTLRADVVGDDPVALGDDAAVRLGALGVDELLHADGRLGH